MSIHSLRNNILNRARQYSAPTFQHSRHYSIFATDTATTTTIPEPHNSNLHPHTTRQGILAFVGSGTNKATISLPTVTKLAKRPFSSNQEENNTDTSSKNVVKTVPIIYVDQLGKEIEVQAEIGKNLLDIAQENNLDLEGACGGELACATCHLIFEKDIYDKLPEKQPEEDDMLDLAFALTDTSRLGCQIKVNEDMAGMKVQIPDDGY